PVRGVGAVAIGSNALISNPFRSRRPRLAPMTDDHEHLAAEVAHFLQHVHDIADLLAARMASLPACEAEALLEQELVRLAVVARRLEAKSGIPEIASSIGYAVTSVIR